MALGPPDFPFTLGRSLIFKPPQAIRIYVFLLGSLLLHGLVYILWLEPNFQEITAPGMQSIDLTNAGSRARASKTANHPDSAAPIPIAATKSAPAAAATSSTSLAVGTAANNGAGVTELPAPEYPRASRALNEQGTVLMEVHFNEQGLSISQALLQSSGFPRLDAAALKSIRELKITPGKDLIKTYKIVFQLKNEP